MSAQAKPLPAKAWALTVVAVTALVGAAVLAYAGLRVDGGGDVVLEVTDAVADVTPSTVPPVDNGSRPRTDDPSAEVADDPGLSPLAELLGPTSSAIPEEIEPRPRPIGMEIDSIDVSSYPIREVGLEDNGQLEVPDETQIGWYRYGATAGRPGATVLAAHVNWRGSLGPFSQLGTVDPGDHIEVALDDGSTRTYEVVERTMYGKLDLPRERIWRNTGPEELVLITCGGEFNPELNSFKQNIVVFAVPVGSGAPVNERA
ncbi:MAG: class F sortase [Ilumatobacteraceae bacterium]